MFLWVALRRGVESGNLGKDVMGLKVVRSGELKDPLGGVMVVGELAGGRTVHRHECSGWGLWVQLAVLHWVDGHERCLRVFGGKVLMRNM